MADDTDQMLIRAYARCRCERSFAELVRRQVNLVHSTALRIVRAAALAEEVSQGVFLALAQHSGRLQGRSSLTGWLYETARNLAINTVRSEERRRQREGEAATMKALIADESQELWQRLAPHLDEAMTHPKRAEREVILWRYFEHETAEQIGVRLGLGQEAAQKRVARAMDHLRAIFEKRGITASAASLAAVLSAEAVKAAPAGLAVAAMAAASGLGTALTTTSTIQMIMASIQTKIGIAALVVASMTAPIVFQHQANQRLQEETAVLRQRSDETKQLREDLGRLRTEALSSENQRAREQTELRPSRSWQNELGAAGGRSRFGKSARRQMNRASAWARRPRQPWHSISPRASAA